MSREQLSEILVGKTQGILREGGSTGGKMVDRSSISLSRAVVGGVSRRKDFPLLPSKVALIVIDVQDYLSNTENTTNLATENEEKNNYLYTKSLPKALSNIRMLVDAFRKLRDDTFPHRYGAEVIFTYLEALTNDCRDVSLDYKLSGPKLAELPGPQQAKFLPELQPSTSIGRGDILVPKTSCSVFNSTNLSYVLRNLQIEQVVLCGQLTDQCVESAARDAADLGYFVTVAQDACAATGTEEHSKGLSGMKGFARILLSQEILLELETSSTAPISPDIAAVTSRKSASIEADPATRQQIKPSSTGYYPSFKRVSDWRPSREVNTSGASSALLKTLRYAGVEFLRLATLDAVNSIRCKAAPIESIIERGSDLDGMVSIAEVCIAGLPTFADMMIAGTNLNAENVLTVKPDLRSLRILPYAKKNALALGTMHNQRTGELSPLCTRGLLARVLETAEDDFGISFRVGAEIEFCLFRENHSASTAGGCLLQAVDESLFGHSTTLNQQESFISDLYHMLKKQDIDVELVHAESASGQLEIVLKYQEDTMKLADDVIFARETIRACAKAHDMRAIFLPKVAEAQAGNGMHLHFSFSDKRSSNPEGNAFQHESIIGATSPMGSSFMEGILINLPALTSVTMCSSNSFRRIGPGCWTGHNVSWSVEDKESPLRVCLDLKTGAATNVEFKLSDSTANIYLELALLLAAGIQGISQSLSLRPMGVANEKSLLPKSFEESLNCLKKNEFLQSVMGKKLSTAYIALREAEIEKTSGLSLDGELASAYMKA